MPQKTETELKKELREGTLSRLYFLYGEEKYLVRHYAELLQKKALGKNFSDFNYQSFHGSECSVDQLAAAVEAFPVFAERKCVRLLDLDAEKLNDSELSKFKELISDLPESTVLLIGEVTLDFDPNRSRWKELLALFKKVGSVVELSQKSGSALEKQLILWAKERGNTLSEKNAAYLCELCGEDLLNLQNELEKLCAFAESGEITRGMIDSVAVGSFESNVFQLSRALLAGQRAKAFEQLDLLFYHREEPIAILAVLSSGYMDIYRVKAALESGKKTQELCELFDYKKKEFRLHNAERDGRKFSLQTVREMLAAIRQTDYSLKSSRTNSRVLMEELLTKLLFLSEKRD